MNSLPSSLANKDSQNHLSVLGFAPKIWPNLTRFCLCISRIRSVGRMWCVIVCSFLECGIRRTSLGKVVQSSRRTSSLEQFFSLPLVPVPRLARRLMPCPTSERSLLTIALHSRNTVTAEVFPWAHESSIAFTPLCLPLGLRERATSFSFTSTLFLHPLTLLGAGSAGVGGGSHIWRRTDIARTAKQNCRTILNAYLKA